MISSGRRLPRGWPCGRAARVAWTAWRPPCAVRRTPPTRAAPSSWRWPCRSGTRSSRRRSTSAPGSTTPTSTGRAGSAWTFSSRSQRFVAKDHVKLQQKHVFFLFGKKKKIISVQGDWKPSQNISTVLTSLLVLMAEPNPGKAARVY